MSKINDFFKIFYLKSTKRIRIIIDWFYLNILRKPRLKMDSSISNDLSELKDKYPYLKAYSRKE